MVPTKIQSPHYCHLITWKMLPDMGKSRAQANKTTARIMTDPLVTSQYLTYVTSFLKTYLQRHSKNCCHFFLCFFPPWLCTTSQCFSIYIRCCELQPTKDVNMGTSAPVTPTSTLLQPRSLHLADSSRETGGQITLKF